MTYRENDPPPMRCYTCRHCDGGPPMFINYHCALGDFAIETDETVTPLACPLEKRE
jgi:hypothetical protein